MAVLDRYYNSNNNNGSILAELTLDVNLFRASYSLGGFPQVTFIVARLSPHDWLTFIFKVRVLTSV